MPDSVGTWHHREPHFKAAQIARLGAAGGIDLVLLGNSAMGHAVDPTDLGERLGVTAYNAAIASASMRGIVRWGLDYVLPALRPSVAILGATSYIFNDAGLNQYRGFEGLLASDGFAASVASVRRGEHGLRELSEELASDTPALEGVIDPVGGLRYREAHDQYTFVPDDAVAGSFSPFAVGGPELKAFRELVLGAADLGTEVIVLDLPHTADFPSKHPRRGVDVEAYRAVLRAACDDLNVSFIDLAPAFATTEGFRDFAHLGPSGRRRLTEMLGVEIDKQGRTWASR